MFLYSVGAGNAEEAVSPTRSQSIYLFFLQSSLIDLSIFALVGGQALSVSVTAERRGGGWIIKSTWRHLCVTVIIVCRLGWRAKVAAQHSAAANGKTFYHPRSLLWKFSHLCRIYAWRCRRLRGNLNTMGGVRQSVLRGENSSTTRGFTPRTSCMHMQMDASCEFHRLSARVALCASVLLLRCCF